MGRYDRESPADLVGRSAELKELAERSARPGVIVIVGPPGVGKSYVLAEFVSGRERDIPVIDLSEVRSIEEALMEVGAALDLPVTSSSTPPERSTALGQAIARTKTDLAFDNAEHVLAPLLETLDAWTLLAPEVRFYLTTRQRPRVAATITVNPLGVPASDDLATVADSDAYRLFARRARKSAPDFELTNANAAGVAQLIRRLEGLPLAVRLAADRLPIMDPRTMLARLNESSDVLGDQSDDERRHRTLRAAVEWSWDLLDENDRHALAQLSTIEGAFDAVTASAVIDVGKDDPLGALSRLVGQSLVAADDVGDRRRLRLLTSVREFALRKAEDLAEAHGARRRLVEYLGARASGWVSAARVDREGPALSEIRTARTQLRQCVTMVIEGRETIDAGVIQCALALCEVHRLEGAPAGWIRSLQRLVALADEAKIDETLVGSLRLRHGDALREALRFGESLAVFGSLAEWAEQHGLVSLQAEALCEASNAAYMQHELTDSRRLLENALEIEDANVAGKLWLQRGRLDHTEGNRSEALEAFGHALAAARTTGDHRTETFALQNLGWLHADLGNLPTAREFVRQAVARHRSRGAHLRLAWALNALGAVENRAGELDRAREHLEEASAILSRCGATSKAAVVLANLAMLSREAGDMENVGRTINEAIALAEVEGLNDVLATCYLILGTSLWSTGHVTRALRALEHQRSLFEGLDSPPHTVNFLVLEGVLRAYEGEIEGAGDCLQRAQREIERLGGDDLLRALVDLNKGHVIISRWRTALSEGRSQEQTTCLFELLEHAREVDSLLEDPAAQSEGLRYSVQMWHRHLPPVVEVMRTAARNPANATSLLMFEELHAFRPPGGEWTDLTRSDTRWAMLREFARSPHEEVPDRELKEAVWPGELIMTDAANNRIYVSISKLRKAGLHSRLSRGEAGYVLECDVIWVSM